MTTIAAFDATLVRVPLTRPWAADVTSVGVIATHVVRSDGAEGWGFSWTPQIGASAVLALLQHDIRDRAIGASADAAELWPALWRHLHEAGGGGITTIALAGLDLALWDAAARAADTSISGLLGRRRESVTAYGSGINLHYDLDDLLAQARRWVDASFDAVKMKVGSPDLRRDLERVAAVREIIGPDRALMVDANQRWDLETATTAVEALAASTIAWIEEPLRADDLAGHTELGRRLRSSSAVPIALGENLHTRFRFADFVSAGAAQIVQPNIVRVGGITPFLQIAGDARAAGAPLHPHLLPELSAQLAMTTPQDVLVEDIEDAGFGDLGALTTPSPVSIIRGRAVEAAHLGLGLRFAGA
ncbi:MULTISPECIES: mandelate racemase/muconate lactonizing enzyme family protein [unclassified Microbacterium]|uniref:mandelate racemase/muconate lactonizing enzyme family protein n=1 Tax=unclassified Microbacterium TaxID=2609290 RepID=UPI003866DE26